jgi:site-specific DNA-methyltransferase (adenine-specific)
VLLGKQFVIRQAVRIMVHSGWLEAWGQGPDRMFVLKEGVAFPNIPDHREGGSMKKSKPPQLAEIPLREIDSSGRYRRDMGDLEALSWSIAEVGLLQPVVLARNKASAKGQTFRLVAGKRRILAVERLERTTIQAYVVDNLEDATLLLQAERDENVCRKEFTPSEAVAIGTELEKLEREAAARRKAQAKGEKRGKKAAGVSPEKFSQENGRAKDKVAEAVGMSRPTFEKARQVVEAAREDSATFGDLPGQMDQTGNVHQAHQELKRRQRRQELEQKAALAPSAGPESARIIEGDCLDGLLRLESDGERFRLGFTDPQYNEGQDYGGGPKADRLPDDVYLDHIHCRLEVAARLLTDDGSLWVLISNRYTADFVLMLRGLGLHQRSLITWYETFGVNVTNNFNRTSRHLLYFVKDPKRFVFNADAVNRQSDRQRKYNDRRADPGGKNWDDVWGIDPPIPRLVGTDTERIPDFPTQLPLGLLLPVVGCVTEPGDLVLDPFSGSATTGAAALQLGRRFVGIERSPRYAQLSRQRLASLCVSGAEGQGREPQGRKAARKKGPAK